MPVWEVQTKVAIDTDWPGCSILAQSSRLIGNDWLLVEGDDLSIAAMRDRPGVVSVDPARDGSYVDPRTGATIEVLGDGSRWKAF